MPLTLPAMVEIGTAYQRRFPDATESEVYAHIATQGQAAVDESVWVECGWARKVRYAATAQNVGLEAIPDYDGRNRRVSTDGKLSGAEMIELGVEFFRANPDATSLEAYDHIASQGEPGLAPTTWANAGYARKAKSRAILSLDAKSNGSRPAAPAPAPDVADQEEPPAAVENPDQDLHTPDQEGPEEEIDDAEEEDGPPAHHQLEVLVPGGRVGANEIEPDRWHVEFEGTLTDDGLRYLLADVLRPLLGRSAPAGAGNASRAAEGV
jgi:hypothetical protein